MSRNLNQLYQSTILEHNKNPKNFGILNAPTHIAHGKNPLCGDTYTLYLQLDDTDCIVDASFHGDGCAISKSSASLMMDRIIGLNVQDVLSLCESFLKLVTSDASVDREFLGKLKIFEGVKAYPVRVKCATLIWHAAQTALLRSGETVSTENS
ncbi:SUF system NifU family Fe-S cluster assembly protein [bacterium]|jgi:nitrogen fixation protein NifU and related proteins|nr:SUF system NifU family Fe-S cluster assembly protein [bacterium]|tara:strand:+ start:812 stop:1270 length:459 start_codon:yes stop_codon:yes gene_type:complete